MRACPWLPLWLTWMATTAQAAQCSIPNRSHACASRQYLPAKISTETHFPSFIRQHRINHFVSRTLISSSQEKTLFSVWYPKILPSSSTKVRWGSLNSWLQPTMHWLCLYASSKPFVLAYSELQSFGNSIVGYLMKVHTSLCTYFCQKSFYCNAKYLLYMTSFCPPTPLN